MNPQVAQIFEVFLWILIVAVIIRSLLTWFPPNVQGSQFGRLLRQFTEPLLDPVRRILPRTGMIDFSAMVVIILLYVAIAVVQRTANA